MAEGIFFVQCACLERRLIHNNQICVHRQETAQWQDQRWWEEHCNNELRVLLKGSETLLKVDVVSHSCRNSTTSTHSVKQKEPKKLVVVVTDTVANPGTVMVHPRHTISTNRAVVRTWWPKQLALKTVSPEHEAFYFVWEVLQSGSLNLVPIFLLHAHNHLICQLFDWSDLFQFNCFLTIDWGIDWGVCSH